MPRFKEPFGEPAIPTRHVSNTNPFRSELQGEALTAALLAELEQAIEEEGPDEVAIVIAEPIQNAGGCLAPPPGYWPGLREICDRHGILLFADEVISGMGRLGEWFAVERYGGKPDLITIAKGLTSAYAPMGAVLAGEKVVAAMRQPGVTLLHGITFGGHPLSAAIALKNIEIFERDGVLENVRRLEPYLRRRLQEEVLSLPVVGDVRGDGFFFAAELTPDGGEGRFEPEQVSGAGQGDHAAAAARERADRPRRRPRRPGAADRAAAGRRRGGARRGRDRDARHARRRRRGDRRHGAGRRGAGRELVWICQGSSKG